MMRAFAEEFGVKPRHAWGMTEISPTGTVCSLKGKHLTLSEREKDELRAKQGRPLFGVEMEIVDEEGKPLPYDGKAFGELLVRGPWVCAPISGVRVVMSCGPAAGLPPATWPPWTPTATCRSPTVLRMSSSPAANGSVPSSWRILLSNIPPSEAAVVGVRHPKWDERPLLVVVTKKDAVLSRDDLMDFMQTRSPSGGCRMTSCSSTPYPTPLPARCSRPNCGRTFATIRCRRLDPRRTDATGSHTCPRLVPICWISMPSKARSGPGPRLRSPRANEGNRRDVGGTLRAAGPAPARRIARCVLEGSAPAAMGRRALAAERERRLRELLVCAADRSPFWQERLAGRDLANFTEADLPSLPVLTRAEMMAEFDPVVTVPGLTLARVQQHLDQSDDDRGYLDDEYQAIITSGYIGTQAVHVYGWDAFITFVMQGSRWTGRRGEDPDAVLAQAFAISTRHESGIFHAFSTFESGGPASHCSGGTQPLDEIVDGLNSARPAG